MILKKALIGFTLCLAAFSLQAEVIDKVIAHVDEDVILQSELDRKVAQAKQQISSRGGQLPPDSILDKEILEQLIVDRIQLQMARKSGITISDAELQQFVQRLAQNNNMSVDEWRLFLASQGINYQLFLQDLNNEILVSRFREAFVSRQIQISEKEIESVIKKMEEDSQATYHLGHILIHIPEQADEALIDEKTKLAISIKKKLESGEDFAELAKIHSSGPNAQNGGDFGKLTLSEMPTLFSNRVSFMNAEEVSDPIRSQTGLHILKVFDIKGLTKHIVKQKHSRHILVKTDKITTDEEAQRLLNAIYERVKAGEADFAEEARKHSDDPGSANLGGDLGWQPSGVFDPAFEQQLNALEEGEMSRPFRSQFGWHIVQFLGERNQDQTQEMKKEQAMKILHQRKFNEEVESWLQEIRTQAYVRKIVEEDA